MTEKVNLLEKVNSTKINEYLNVGILNNNVLNVLQTENRTLDFHMHENSDELFLCLEGEFCIEFSDNKLTHLQKGDFIIIPRKTIHRPVCKNLVKVLLMELDGTLNNTNTGGTFN